jgi:hypothetical protein
LLAGDGVGANQRGLIDSPKLWLQKRLILKWWRGLVQKKRCFEADIQSSDFVDLGSAIDSLLSQYGPVDSALTLDSKMQLLLEYLDDYPTLIIARRR